MARLSPNPTIPRVRTTLNHSALWQDDLKRILPLWRKLSPAGTLQPGPSVHRPVPEPSRPDAMFS